MEIDINEIELSSEQKQLIAERATQQGQSWQAVLEKAIGPHPTEEEDWLDTEYMDRCAEERRGKEPIGLERVREILSKVPGSMADDIIADRGDR